MAKSSLVYYDPLVKLGIESGLAARSVLLLEEPYITLILLTLLF